MVRPPFQPPFGEFPLGTDVAGRDILAGIVHGAGVSLMIGIVATICATVAWVALLHAMFADLAGFGATARGGLHRLAASPEDGLAHDYLRDWLHREGFEVRVDRVGNIYGVLPLARPDAPLVLTGSHLDSQPSGGRFDGTYGVVASCGAVRSVRGRGGPFSRNLGVVAWTNEEGTRLERIAQARGYRTMRLHTIAGHDAVPLCAICRSAMIFVPSVAGVSHREDELTHPADLEAGASVLADALRALATP